jgi:hypothetical protein
MANIEREIYLSCATTSPGFVTILVVQRCSYHFESDSAAEGRERGRTFTAGQALETRRTKYHDKYDSVIGVRLSSPMNAGSALGTGGASVSELVDVAIPRVRATSSMDVDVAPFQPISLPRSLAILWLQLYRRFRH